MIYSSLYIEAGKSPSNNFIQLLADHSGTVDAGKTLSFTVKATEPLPSITYQVKLLFISKSLKHLLSVKLNIRFWKLSDYFN